MNGESKKVLLNEGDANNQSKQRRIILSLASWSESSLPLLLLEQEQKMASGPPLLMLSSNFGRKYSTDVHTFPGLMFGNSDGYVFI